MLLLACFALLAVVAAAAAEAEGDLLPSPCPEVFKYEYDGRRWSGFLRVPVPVQAKRMVVVVSLFVIDALLPPEHPGELQILGDERKIKEEIRRNETDSVVYLLELPIQAPLPVVERVKVNRNVICQGPKVKAHNRTKVTYTHRLNGLRPQPPGRLDDQSNAEQGRMVGLDKHNPKKFNEQGNTFVGNGKGDAYNNLELLENEMAEILTQEEDIFPKHKTDDVNTESDEDAGDTEELSEDNLDESPDAEWSDGENVDEDSGLRTRLNDDDEEETPGGGRDSDLDPKQDAEMLNNKIPGAVVPPPSGQTPDYDEDEDEDEEEGASDTGIDPNKDAEMLDNNIPDAVVPNKPNSVPSDDDEDDVGETEEDDSDIDLDLTEDAEMLDNKISETVGPKPKNPTFNVEEFDDFADNELDPNYNTKMSDNDIYP